MSLLHPAQTDRRPHTRDAGRHTKSTTQRPGGTSHNTPAGLGAHARAPPPPRSHQRHRGGGSWGGDDASPSSSFPHARQQANARHHSRPGRFHTRKGSRNPQPPRHGGPAQGEAKHSRVTATRVGKRMRKRAKETGARAARQAEEGAGKGRRGRTRATHATTVRAEGPHHAAGRPASRARAHNPHHHTRDLTASTLRGQGRSRGDGKAVPDAANRGPSCLSHSHPNTHLHAGKTTGPAPATSHGQTPTPQGPHRHAGSGALKEPTLPRRGRANGPARSDSEGGWGPHQGHGGRGTGGTRERTQGAPWATKAGPAGETDTGSHRHTPGRSRDAWDTGARLWRPSTSSPTHTQEPRRQGASTRHRQQPHTPDGPRAISRPSNHPDLHARRSTATPRERSPQGRPRGPRGKRGLGPAQHTCRPPPDDGQSQPGVASRGS